jgi:hypothetical protein
MGVYRPADSGTRSIFRPVGRRPDLTRWQSHTTVSISGLNFLRRDNISGGKAVSYYENRHTAII